MGDVTPSRILHVDLDGALPAVPRDPHYGRVHVYFWRHGVPAGHRVFAASELPLTPEQMLRSAPPPTGGVVPPSIDDAAAQRTSVVVCTRDRPRRLERCLASLRALRQPPREILVVDNAPRSDATRHVVAGMRGIAYLCEPRVGLDVARNTALRHTASEIVAFTDDDVIVDGDWLGRLVACFRDPQVMVATGLVLPAELETAAQVVFQETFGGLHRGYEVRRYGREYFAARRWRGVPVWNIGAGANMAVRRKVVELVGGFDDRLDVGAAGCSGDSEFWYRVLAAGWACAYTPAAVVYHRHRRQREELRRQAYLYMRGHVAAALVQFERHRHWGNLLHVCLELPAYYAWTFAKALVRGFPVESRMLLMGIPGSLAGFGFYARGMSARRNAARAPGRSVAPA